MFNIEEKSLIKMYVGKTPNRLETLEALNGCLAHIEHQEIKEVISSIVERLRGMSDAAFLAIDMSDVLYEETDEEKNQ